MGRPVDKHEPIPRLDLISLENLEAEGASEEVKTILGWLFNTCSLTLSLPIHKCKAWIKTIEEIIDK